MPENGIVPHGATVEPCQARLDGTIRHDSSTNQMIVPDRQLSSPSGVEKLEKKTADYAAILKPHEDSEIIYLCTPQTEQSIYRHLPGKGNEVRIWPARYAPAGSLGRLLLACAHRAPFIEIDLTDLFQIGCGTEKRLPAAQRGAFRFMVRFQS